MLDVRNLSIAFHQHNSTNVVISDFTFQIQKGECVGMIGSSGSGKTVCSLALTGLLNRKYTSVSGDIFFGNNTPINLIQLKEKDFTRIRGKRLSLMMQEPMNAFNPVYTCGHQVAETLLQHTSLTRKEAEKKTLELFERVSLRQAAAISKRYPHQLSGGQLQRVAIAMAISCNPQLLIADEPTTALDATVQKDLLNLLKEIQHEMDMSMLFISHDLEVIRYMTQRTLVVSKGNIVEQGSTQEIFSAPKHDYTKALLRSINADFPKNPKTESTTCLLEVDNLSKTYRNTNGLLKIKHTNHVAIENLSFKLNKGETLGVAGESGCGKTTLARMILRLSDADQGTIIFNDESLMTYPIREKAPWRKNIQYIFQNPHGALNPSMTIGALLMEPAEIFKTVSGSSELKKLALEWLKKLDLSEDLFNRYVSTLSTGQKQRICIARALIPSPELLICDEAVSALDASVQSQILSLIKQLQQQMGFSCIFISHHLKTVKQVSDRIIIMHDGKIAESGAVNDLFNQPQSPYTRQLINSIL